MWTGRISRRRALLASVAVVALVAVAVGAVVTRSGPPRLTWTSLLNATYALTRVTREVTRRYELQGGSLVLLDETESEVPSTPAEDFVYQPQRIDLAAGGTRDLSGSLAPGRIAAFVVAGHAGEVLELE